MRGGKGATQGGSERRSGRDGNFWSGCVLAGSALTTFVACTIDFQPCPDVPDSSVDIPSGIFAPAEGRHLERLVGTLQFTESFPRAATGLTVPPNALGTEGRPPYDASAYSSPPEYLPTATLTIDRGLGIVTRSYLDAEGRMVEERWRFKWAP
jgi:hypothetical protein